jgi:tetratricopeptide (TPR) repeat protein
MKKSFILFIAILFATVLSQNSEAQVTRTQDAQAKRDTINAHLKKAQILFGQGNITEASKIYTAIMQSEPDNRDAVQGWLMANIKRTQTGEEEAIKQLEELGKLYPRNTGILFFKAFLEAENKHNEEALKDVDKLIALQPDTAINYVIKGQVLGAMENYNEAFQAFDKATSMDPKRLDVWGMKAGTLAKMGNFDDAVTAANKGIELAPNNPVVIYNRACIYSLKGDKAKALADLGKAISMNPAFKEYARKDEDFRKLYDDEDFKNLTQ